MGCGVANQRTAIRDARYGLVAAGAVQDALDGAADTLWCQGDPANTDAYCSCKRAAIVLEQSRIAIEGGALAVKEWETALVIYEASKTDVGWALVTGNQAAWIALASQLVGILEGVRASLDLWGIKLPKSVAGVWQFIVALSPYGKTETPEWDWSSLNGTVCEVKP